MRRQYEDRKSLQLPESTPNLNYFSLNSNNINNKLSSENDNILIKSSIHAPLSKLNNAAYNSRTIAPIVDVAPTDGYYFAQRKQQKTFQ